MWFFKKVNPRRTRVRESITAERISRVINFANVDIISSVLLWLLFVTLCASTLSFELILNQQQKQILPLVFIVILISIALAFYVYHYQGRIIKNRARATALVGLFLFLLVITKIGTMLTNQSSWATGTAIAAIIILTISYDQRAALGLSIFYCLFACFAALPNKISFTLFVTMAAGIFTCCFSLREIRTRMKLLEVSVLAAMVVLITAVSLGFLTTQNTPTEVIIEAGYHSLAAFLVGLLMQALLPLIEKVFRIATSMTLLDYTDANQPLLKRLAMEAPGTFSHSLLIGSIAEAAAEAIGRNGLLCRVGAYYHDIGKINKPNYFVENEMGSASRHKDLSPAMSQLIIIGHVKDGIEMAKEYALPAVLRQFIETHHGTTLVEYFFNEAKKKRSAKNSSEPSESEFRYAGPKPRTKEAAIVMLADSIEGAVRSLTEITPPRVEAVIHNMAMKRLQDGQFDECDISLRELSQVEAALSKALLAHYHSRIAYPHPPDAPQDAQEVDN
jgi:putative nucleotidyltransferase with HDIG domain